MNERETKFIRELYLELAPKLLSYARIVLKNDALAEEAVQDTFGDACAKVDMLIDHPNPQAWMVVALRTTFKQQAAHRAHDAALLERISGGGSEVSHSDEEDPDLLYGDLADSEDYRLLRRYTDEGLTVAELADELGITVGACQMRLQRARQRLRKHFEGRNDR